MGLIHSPASPDASHDQLIQEAQKALTSWENILTATGGALALEKSHWCLVEAVWKAGRWSHATSQERPGELTLQNGQFTVQRCEATEDNEALGIRTRPDGQMQAEKAYLKKRVKTWCEAPHIQKSKALKLGTA